MLSTYNTQPYFYKVFLHLNSLIISKKEYLETFFQDCIQFYLHARRLVQIPALCIGVRVANEYFS